MSNSSTNLLALVLALSTVDSALASAQSQSSALSSLESSTHDERRSEFYSLLSSADSGASSLSFRARMERFAVFAKQHPRVRRGVIALLERENGDRAAQVDEDAYYGDVIGAVAAFKDPSAVNALMGAITTGEMATRGLAALGDAAVPALLGAVGPSAPRIHMSALLTLSEMITLVPAPVLSHANRKRIRTVLLGALDDSNSFAREVALDGLVAFRDPETRRAVALVAEGDPLVLRDRGRVRYPVREAALATLRKLDAAP